VGVIYGVKVQLGNTTFIDPKGEEKTTVAKAIG
jgi:hypothetical protein